MVLKFTSFLFFVALNFIAIAFDSPPSTDSESDLFLMERAEQRVLKKPFGLYVSPSDSPVSPERFSGYHTGVDFEVFDDELEVEIPIHAICEGEVRFLDWVRGYGGVLIQDCELQDAPVTVLYGHIDLESVSFEMGDVLSQGELLGHLGEGFSAETDGERKHLHLAIHRGGALEFQGYVSAEKELEGWIDPLMFF